MTKSIRIAVLWREPMQSVAAEVVYGRLSETSPVSSSTARFEATIADAKVDLGACQTRVTIRATRAGGAPVAFTFFLRDVSKESPIFIPSLGAAVVPVDDRRTYAEIEADVRRKGLISEQQRIDAQPEETYEAACDATRDQPCPTWLAVGRDMRTFRVDPIRRGRNELGYWGQIEPWDHSVAVEHADGKGQVVFQFIIGRGAMCSVEIERRLEDGVLPILRSVQRDGDVEYHLTLFATLETKPLSATAVRGTNYVSAYGNTGGRMLTDAEKKQYDETRVAEVTNREEELICWVRVEAINTAGVPRYAYFRHVAGGRTGDSLDATTGFELNAANNQVSAISHIDGKPFPQSELAVQLAPGASVVADFLVPHRPISRERAIKLAAQDFREHLDACRAYWRGKLESGATISVPEPAIDERIRAGLLHLDVNTLGLEKDGPLLACVGWYSPIGSESSPMIQFYDAMGWHKIAERCIDFFLERQRDDGFIQTFGGYQLETGPALWTIGEHFRMTRDGAWAKRVKPRVMKACRYVLDWRRRNLRDELRGKGYGLIDGKVADPEDFFHSFMLNGLAYVGLKRVAEMYEQIDPAEAKSLASECEAYLKDIRVAYHENVERSPVVPIGDGSWVPTFGPWSEYPGPLSLYADGGSWNTHGAFASRDTLIGALYLVIGEVLDANEPAADWMVQSHQELMTHRNAGFSQPYYCRHDYIHLKRGEVKAYLKTYFNQFAALQDRETYTFWEHYYGVSQHKTHEEGWFLMQTRWMLWHEEGGDTLKLLSMIPRRWMEDGKTISLRNCVSHFGRFDLSVTSRLGDGTIEATFSCDATRAPRRVEICLPHPSERRPREVRGGTYDAKTESIIAEPRDGRASVAVVF